MTRIVDKLSALAIEGQMRSTFREFQMPSNVRLSFWVETSIAAISGLLALLTTVFPNWLEFVSGWGPDQQDGSVEWLIVVGLFLIFVVMVVAATIESRRDLAAAST